MRRFLSAVAVLAFAGTLFAQSPFVGTWKLDLAKTHYSAGEPPKGVTLTIEEQGDNLHVTAKGSNADGSQLSVSYTVPLRGGDGKVDDGPYDAINSKMISDRIRDNTYMKNGRQVATRHIVILKDGKTMRSIVKGVNATGQSVAGIDVYVKQ